MYYSKDLLLYFCLFSPFIAGIVSLPGNYLNWWAVCIGYPIFCLSLFLFFSALLYCLFSKNRIKNLSSSPIIRFEYLGLINVDSSTIYINDSFDKEKSEKIDIYANILHLFAEYDETGDPISLCFTSQKEKKVLHLATQNTIHRNIIVDSGCIFLFSDGNVSLHNLKYQHIGKLHITTINTVACKINGNDAIEIHPPFGDGTYNILLQDNLPFEFILEL